MTVKVVRLVAAARQFHGGRLLFPGDVFEAPEGEARDLVALNFARLAPLPAVLRPLTALTSLLEPEPETPSTPRRGRYGRRDLRVTK